MTMTRQALQELSRQRLREAKLLLRSRYWSGAYYVAGYAVECALKACIARQRGRHEFPPHPREATRLYSHDLAALFAAARLRIEDDPALDDRWSVTKDWSPEARYVVDVSEAAARDYIAAIAGRKGVLGWLKRHW